MDRDDTFSAAALTLYTVDGSGGLLALRRSFRHRDAGGAWLPSLHAHRAADEDAVDAARRVALTMLGVRLAEVQVLAPDGTRTTPACPTSAAEVGPVLVGTVGHRVVTPDPTLFDDAGWVGGPVEVDLRDQAGGALWSTAFGDVRPF